MFFLWGWSANFELLAQVIEPLATGRTAARFLGFYCEVRTVLALCCYALGTDQLQLIVSACSLKLPPP